MVEYLQNIQNSNPDFIYLDGPDQFNVRENGINLKHNDMMPMANDLIKN